MKTTKLLVFVYIIINSLCVEVAGSHHVEEYAEEYAKEYDYEQYRMSFYFSWSALRAN